MLERLRRAQLRQQVIAVVGMHGVVPGRSGGVCGRHPGVVEPAPVEVRRVSVDVGAPHDLRHRVGELAVARLARPLEREQLLLVQAPVLLPQIDEDGDLGAQQVGVDRLEDVVDRADLVSLEDLLVVLGKRGDEDDRDVLRARALLDHARGLEAVDVRHVDVQEDAGEVVQEDLAQRRDARVDAHEEMTERFEHRLERDEVLLAVVDEQDRRAIAHAPTGTATRASARATDRCRPAS